MGTMLTPADLTGQTLGVLLATLALPIVGHAFRRSAVTGRALLVVGVIIAGLVSAVAPVVARQVADDYLPVRTLATTTPPSRVVTVVKGDSMWSITAADVGPGEPVAPRWRRVVAVNRRRIISGNPDLIYPGEKIVLPPPGGETITP